MFDIGPFYFYDMAMAFSNFLSCGAWIYFDNIGNRPLSVDDRVENHES